MEYPIKKIVPIGDVKSNPNNPRVIKDDKFEKLVRSLKEFPEMMSARPVVVNKDMIVLGGNMRLKAAVAAGWSEMQIMVVDWDEDKQRQFIIKDNISGGEWDFEMLANQWDANELSDWGVDVWKPNEVAGLDEFFEGGETPSGPNVFKITLEYSEDDYNQIQQAFKNYPGTKEEIVFKLLTESE